MRLGLIFALGLTTTSLAIPDVFEPAGEVYHPLIPKTGKRSVTIVKGLQAREFAAIPAGGSLAEESDDAPTKRRSRLRKAEVIVPDSLQDPASKRAVYCSNSSYGLCSNKKYCCPLGGSCCSTGGCCSSGYYCDSVDGEDGCCPNGKVCTGTSNACVDDDYVKCSNYDYCCKPGYTCYRDSAGAILCRAGSSSDDETTTKRTTTTTRTTTTMIQVTENTFTDLPTSFNLEWTTTTTTTTPPLAFATTTPTPAAAASTPSSSSTTSSTVNVPLTAQGNGAMAVTSGWGQGVLMSVVALALGHVLIIA
ncbi:hypothetical protein FS837_008635 [Tulasnella sp. UAMH 9824]|nr:hypothetical protein FS837_008635 [Tulasnella sp. UAMH 9824]